MIVAEIKIGQAREIDIRDDDAGVITRFVFRQGDIGVAAHVSRKKRAAKIDKLQPVVCEKKSPGDAIERQSLAQKSVVHAVGCIDRDFEPRILAAAKLVNAVCSNIGRLPEFIRHNRLPQRRVNPKNRVGGTH